MPRPADVWLAAGVRTPFAKVDGALSALDAIELSVPVARHMVDQLKGGKPDFAVWAVVVPSLTFSNIAREVLMDAGIDATAPAFSTVMACSTSMMGAVEAASMLDGETYNLGFFDDLVVPLAGVTRDTIPRKDTSLDKLTRLSPSFDRTSGRGTLTAGNSSPLTDGAAALWVASSRGLERLPAETPRVKLADWEIASVDFRVEGLLMAPAFAMPRLLARHGLAYGDIHLWEIHEAFAAQVAFHLKALESADFLRDKAKVPRDFGAFPVERINPNGGSAAIGHPFAATGARILSQAVKELSAMPKGNHAIVRICADGGQGSVMLLEAA